MDKETICKVSIKDTIYKVNMLVDENGGQHGYRVMKGRHIAQGGSWFRNEREAIKHMLRLAFIDVVQLTIDLTV